ncbi:uncharacterized protein BJ171DRAFT_458658 [Polychytrium aggregatum]|uniref:uncharacterized protein n=1 Tax=Polychytrium aggregatum TaxID=110093 RepID=UPI0022FE38C0|nr:uncharacterized protein BJ171DRAFT_458658 [Polychytrium aggregatum]KAI9205006.1 hypothetical protein BJ171DRAFT_458658 [Polychytrium aggregatum]
MVARKELRGLFRTGPEVIGRFGDMISNATIEAIQGFEKTNLSRLCKNAISTGICDADDVGGYLQRKAGIAAPRDPTLGSMSQDRLFFQVTPNPFNLEAPDHSKAREWICIYATNGIWKHRLLAQPSIKRLVQDITEKIRQNPGASGSNSYNQAIARVLDAVHPSHRLLASTLAYPMSAPSLIKKRLSFLGYAPPNPSDEISNISQMDCLTTLRQLNKRLDEDHRFYFEFTVLDKSDWRCGFICGKHISPRNHLTFPGKDPQSLGFSSDGSVYYNGEARPFDSFAEIKDMMVFAAIRTYGILVDLGKNQICLVVDNKILPPGFGTDAAEYSLEEQIEQSPEALLCHSNLSSAYADPPQLKANFGSAPFSFSVLGRSFDSILAHRPAKHFDSDGIFDPASVEHHRASQEEEERLQLTLEKTQFKASMLADTLKSFSQFPPSIYRRSLACMRIQRVWRRHRGRMERKRIREEQYAAATIIQRMARNKLKKLRARKNEAAAIIQRNWRKLMYIRLALLRCIYQQPIPELHRCAEVIQRKWRHWFMFRNSPIATRYNARIEVLNVAANKIINWWRPLFKKINETKKIRERHKAATDIQRVYRGVELRKLLRPDLRERLRRLGESVASHREELFRIRGAYILQNAWRAFLVKRVRSDKIKTRNRAAARIQAFWKGYWVRSHIHLRFSYGESVFLNAVQRAMKNCHFIIKMYKPCGIVCPRRDLSSLHT